MDDSTRTVDPSGIIEAGEMRDFARVAKAALGVLVHHWTFALRLPAQHPYRQAASMLARYLERRYGV